MSTELSTYETFISCLSQLDQDQSLYESQLGEELLGENREEIVRLGADMCKKLKKFASLQQSFADSLPPDFILKLTDAIQSYQDLIMPPKIFGGICPCIKPARSGVEYDRKFLLVESKMISTLFLCQAVVIDYKADKINMEGMKCTLSTDKINSIQNTLAAIKVTGGDKNLETLRKKLLSAMELVDKYVQSTDDDEPGVHNEFVTEANRRLRKTQDLISPKLAPGETARPISKRILVNIQSSLQEIMNSAGAINLTKARDNLIALENFSKALKTARDFEVKKFNSMENSMHEHNLMDHLHRLREDSEVVHSDASNKIKMAVKAWTAIKEKSKPRKVAEYEEEIDHRNDFGPADPTKILNNLDRTGKDIKKGVGSLGEAVTGLGSKVVGGVVGGVGGVVEGVGGVVKEGVHGIQSVAQTGATGAKQIVTTGANNAIKVGNKTREATSKLLGNEPEPPPKPPKKQGLMDKISKSLEGFDLGSDTESSNGGFGKMPLSSSSLSMTAQLAKFTLLDG